MISDQDSGSYVNDVSNNIKASKLYVINVDGDRTSYSDGEKNVSTRQVGNLQWKFLICQQYMHMHPPTINARPANDRGRTTDQYIMIRLDSVYFQKY